MPTTEPASIPSTVFLEEFPLSLLEFFEGEFTQQHVIVCVSALPRPRYKAAFEIGCATGMMTEKLARRCDEVIAIDPSEQLLEAGRARCKDFPGVQFVPMTFPDQRPDRRFDLVVFADLGYFWTLKDLDGIFEHMIEVLEPGGHLLMTHSTFKFPKCPTSGTELHDRMIEGVNRGNGLKHLTRRDSWIGYDPGWPEEVMAKAIEANGICPVCGLPNVPRLEPYRLDIFERL